MADASIKLRLEGLDDLIAVVERLEKFQASMGGVGATPGGGVGAPSSTAAGGAIAMPPPASTPPTTLSPASQGAGSPAVAVQTMQPALQPPNQPSTLAMIGATLGGVQAWHQATALFQASAGGYAQAAVQGRPFYAESMIPTAWGLGIAAAGAAIGSIVPGIGTTAGFLVGSAIGGAASNYLQPLIERDIKADELGTLGYAMGASLPGNPALYSEPQLSFYDRMLRSGRYLPSGLIGSAHTLPGPQFDSVASALERGVYSLPYIQRYGVPSGEVEEFSFQQLRDALRYSAWDDPLQASAAMRIKGWEYIRSGAYVSGAELLDEADKARDLYGERMELSAQERPNRARLGLRSYELQRAGRYGGAAGFRRALPGARAAFSREEARMLREAALAEEHGLTDLAAAMRDEISLARMQFEDMSAEGEFSLIEDQISASSALASGRASRSFTSALYSGKSVGELPWEQRASAVTMQATMLSREMERRRSAGKLSPAMEARFTEQIEQLNFEALVGIPRERESMANREALAGAELYGARALREAMPGLTRGGIIEQLAGPHETRLKALQEEERVLQKILETSRYLTAEERTRLQTSIEQVKAQQEQSKAAADYARIQGRIMYAAHETSGVLSSTSIRLMYGAGGDEAGAILDQRFGAVQRELGTARSALQEARAKFAADSPQVMEAERNVWRLERASAEADLSRATVPLSATQRIHLSNLQAQQSIMQMGYGSFGDIRMNLRSQLGVLSEHMRESQAQRSRGQREGWWTEEHEARYTEDRNQQLVMATQLMYSHDFGWEHRLVSEAYNVPGSGILRARQSRYEAMLRGIMAPWLGGTEEATRGYREMYPRMMRMFGTGSPQGFSERGAALGLNAPEPRITVTINLENRTGVDLRANVGSINAQPTAQTVNVNQTAAKKPSG